MLDLSDLLPDLSRGRDQLQNQFIAKLSTSSNPSKPTVQSKWSKPFKTVNPIIQYYCLKHNRWFAQCSILSDLDLADLSDINSSSKSNWTVHPIFPIHPQCNTSIGSSFEQSLQSETGVPWLRGRGTPTMITFPLKWDHSWENRDWSIITLLGIRPQIKFWQYVNKIKLNIE